MSKVTEVTGATFDQEVLQAERPVIVDFWAPWCGPCRMMAPVFDELASEYGDKVKFAKLNVDESPDIAQRYGVMSIPTLIVFRGGEPEQQHVGFRGKPHLEQVVQGLAG